MLLHRFVRAVVVVLIPSLAAQSALAGDSFLAASDWEAPPGAEVTITEHQGEGFAGEALAHRRGRITRLVIRDAEERDLSASALGGPAEGDAYLAAVTLRDDDGLLVGLETEPVIIRRSAAELDEHARLNGFRGMASLRESAGVSRAGRERQVTCQKLWLEGDDGRRARKPLGLTLELVPSKDPSDVSRAKFQLLFRGRPVSGALVHAYQQPFDLGGSEVPPGSRLGLPVRERATTDERGIVRLDVSKRGEYLVTAAHAVPCKDPNVADWDTFWASMSFARSVDRIARSSEPRTLRGTGLYSNPDLGMPAHDRSRSLRDIPGWGRLSH